MNDTKYDSVITHGKLLTECTEIWSMLIVNIKSNILFLLVSFQACQIIYILIIIIITEFTPVYRHDQLGINSDKHVM